MRAIALELTSDRAERERESNLVGATVVAQWRVSQSVASLN